MHNKCFFNLKYVIYYPDTRNYNKLQIYELYMFICLDIYKVSLKSDPAF